MICSYFSSLFVHAHTDTHITMRSETVVFENVYMYFISIICCMVFYVIFILFIHMHVPAPNLSVYAVGVCIFMYMYIHTYVAQAV